eukprot:CAMPEP_0178896808 /NCGR_PEP_ID=MMETSP0786-20121207/1390_1 /TAXON_ID=186022 /ORGANISM="Thalassionema frauenfeldii, Strain CCMP 1798" /LENGTH=267 /DNA_ID=CAMNT_0020567275 /DNA_START=234 /DNA_END=1033 /DNA_ORIENTATION=-
MPDKDDTGKTRTSKRNIESKNPSIEKVSDKTLFLADEFSVTRPQIINLSKKRNKAKEQTEKSKVSLLESKSSGLAKAPSRPFPGRNSQLGLKEEESQEMKESKRAALEMAPPFYEENSARPPAKSNKKAERQEAKKGKDALLTIDPALTIESVPEEEQKAEERIQPDTMPGAYDSRPGGYIEPVTNRSNLIQEQQEFQDISRDEFYENDTMLVEAHRVDSLLVTGTPVNNASDEKRIMQSKLRKYFCLIVCALLVIAITIVVVVLLT